MCRARPWGYGGSGSPRADGHLDENRPVPTVMTRVKHTGRWAQERAGREHPSRLDRLSTSWRQASLAQLRGPASQTGPGGGAGAAAGSRRRG